MSLCMGLAQSYGVKSSKNVCFVLKNAWNCVAEDKHWQNLSLSSPKWLNTANIFLNVFFCLILHCKKKKKLKQNNNQ